MSKAIKESKCCIFLLGSILLSFILLDGCSRNQISISQTEPSQLSPSPTEIASTYTPTSINTPVTQTVTPAWKMDTKYVTGFGQFLFTQGPVIFSTSSPQDSVYLYKDVIVTFDLVDRFNAIAYLNLDDLNDNSGSNSDIRIERTRGNPEITYEIDPSNDSYFYYAGDNLVDYESCKESILNLDIDRVHYTLQAYSFIEGGKYCILTNEGRIGIVNYIIGSKKAIGTDHEEELSVDISVFNEIIN